MLVGVQISSTLTFDFVSVIVLPRLCVSLQTQQRKEYLKNCFTELLTCMELISLSHNYYSNLHFDIGTVKPYSKFIYECRHKQIK